MNSVNLVGNLASDPEMREAGVDAQGNTRHVTNFLLAVNRPGKDAGADFIRVAAWNGQARSCAEYLSKGKKVAVTGRISSSRYPNPDNSEKMLNAIEISAQRVEFLSPAPNGNGSNGVVATEEAKQTLSATHEGQAQEPVEAVASADDIPF